jgi:signal transduction histidine kinase
MAEHPPDATPAPRAAGEEDRLRARSAFLRDLAHEISTPLTPLAGYLRILQGEKVGPLAPQQRRLVDSMLLSVARLTRVVENLGDFASLGSERAPLSLEPVDPDRLAERVVEDLRPFIKDARLDVRLSLGGGGPVRADPRKLRQALANVVSNAVKFSPRGAGVLVEVAREGGRVRFAVYDQGPGVRAEDVEGIFEPFHRALLRSRESARHHPGSGLGLPVARRIAEAHGGRIWVESPPRSQPAAGGRHFGGARVTIELPASPGEAALR